jgi:hypothetical protein
MNRGYTRDELTVAAASREIRDREMVFAAMRVPMPIMIEETKLPTDEELGATRAIDPEGFWTGQ